MKQAGRQRVCYLSLDLISVSRYRQELCWFVRAVERAAASRQSQCLIHKLCTAPHLAALSPSDYFSVHRFSVCLRLGGELSKMITLCIKHAAVSNFSFPCLSSLPPPHLSLYPVSVSQIRWEKNITLGEPPGFLHSWWWYVYVEVLSSS